ncbi:unnamed protein product [Larinioides sclopetarius]|uniref:Uncharacterized protein n=1 Tax=Larinioides sclopetarius TaxID=280406 RepID=A0AAV2A5J2_9ARAC
MSCCFKFLRWNCSTSWHILLRGFMRKLNILSFIRRIPLGCPGNVLVMAAPILNVSLLVDVKFMKSEVTIVPSSDSPQD